MRKFLSAFCFSLIYSVLNAGSFVSIEALHDLNKSTVYSISQSPSGAILIETRDGMYNYNGYTLRRLDSRGNNELSRTVEFIDEQGNIYRATGHGLTYKSALNGSQTEIPLNGTKGQPVTCIFQDRDGNLWVGTYYSGVYFKSINSDGIDIIDIPHKMQNIRSLICDAKGNIWSFTDNSGAYCFSLKSGSWSLVPGSDGIKFQNACYDGQSNSVWSYDGEDGLFSIDCSSRTIRKTIIDAERFEGIYAMLWKDGKLLLGGQKGFGVMDPATGKIDFKSGNDYSCGVYDMLTDAEGKVWLCGYGIYSFNGQSLKREDDNPLLEKVITHDIDIDNEGRIWAATLDYGAAKLENGHITMFNMENSGIAANYANTVSCMDNGDVIIGTGKGISVIDRNGDSLVNYGKSLGVGSNTTTGRSSIKLKDGSVWIGTSDGIITYRADAEKPSECSSKPAIDRILIDGRETASEGEKIVLKHNQNNVTIYVSDYDYSRIFPSTYTFTSNARGSSPLAFDISEPLSFNEMSVGKHEVTISKKYLNSGKTEDIQLEFEVRAAWYACTAAYIVYSLLTLAAIIAVIAVVYSKKMLVEKLNLSEMERRKSAKFYVDLSYNTRTPLNMIISILEKFFKDYGNRTVGIEQLEEVYYNSTKIRKILLEHIDSQEALLNEDPSDSKDIQTKARFLNSVTGAIERHLFAGEKVSVTTICSELHMGKTKLTAQLHEVTGMTPGQFIEDVKLNYAHKLLQEGNLRINEISSMFSFCSPGYFATKFREKFGYPPKDVKKKSADAS